MMTTRFSSGPIALRARLLSAGWLLAGLLLAGCGSLSTVIAPSSPPMVPIPGSGVGFGGKVMAGTMPVVGGSVQLYAAGTTGSGSTATALSTAVTTDAAGSFQIAAGTYSCPATGSVLLLVAGGGHVGANAANAAIELVSSPGVCSAVGSGASYVVNERTTVAAAYAFSAFLGTAASAQTGFSLFGASATNGSGIALAAGTFANLVNPVAGTSPGAAFPATGVAPVGRLNALANALNACAVSIGAGSSACSSLLATAGGGLATNLLQAASRIVRLPGTNVAALYALTMGSSVYSPALTTSPPDWTLYVTYNGGGMNDPTAVSIDSTGRVWVANYEGVASLFANTGAPVFAVGLSGQGLGDSYGGAVDGSDNFWSTNEPDNKFGSGSSVTVFTSGGTAVAGSPYTAGGLNYPVSIAFDTTGTAWVVDYGDSHLSLLSGSGAAQSGSNGYDGVQGGVGTFEFPVAVAVDGRRQGWMANQSGSSVTRVAADGSNFTAFTVGAGPSGVAVDANNNVWTANYYGDSVGAVSAGGAVVSGATGFAGGGLDHPQGIAVDGAGTVWAANLRAPGLTELAGFGSPLPNAPGVGAVISPAAGWAPDANPVEAFSIAVDAGGSLWVTGFGSNTLTEYIGLATPVKTPLLGPVRVP